MKFRLKREHYQKDIPCMFSSDTTTASTLSDHMAVLFFTF